MIIIDIKKNFEFNAIRARNFLEGEYEGFFWNNINLLLSVQDLCDKSTPQCEDLRILKLSLFSLSSDFVNLVVASYRLLENAFEKECFLLIRKGYETIWLLDTFRKKPVDAKKWISTDKFNFTNTYPVDIKKDSKTYQRLSRFVHPNSQLQGAIMGLLFVEFYSVQIFYEIIVCICTMIESLFKTLEKLNNICANKYKKPQKWFSEKESVLHLLLLSYDENLELLIKFGQTNLNPVFE